jgi:hypothetical protein
LGEGTWLDVHDFRRDVQTHHEPTTFSTPDQAKLAAVRFHLAIVSHVM